MKILVIDWIRHVEWSTKHIVKYTVSRLKIRFNTGSSVLESKMRG